jgi:hypothetical protein
VGVFLYNNVLQFICTRIIKGSVTIREVKAQFTNTEFKKKC